MRAAAEVGERAVGVQRHGLQRVLGVGVALQILDQLDLVRLLLGGESRQGRLGRDILAHERLVGVDVALHLGLDPLEVRIVDGDALGELEVVVEAVVDRGADRDLDAGVQVEHRRREHVRGVVADQRQRLLPRAFGQDLELRRPVAVGRRGQLAAEVPQLAVDLDRQRGASQTRADRRGGIGAGGAVGQAQRRAVGKHVVHAGRDASDRGRYEAVRATVNRKRPISSGANAMSGQAAGRVERTWVADDRAVQRDRARVRAGAPAASPLRGG